MVKQLIIAGVKTRVNCSESTPHKYWSLEHKNLQSMTPCSYQYNVTEGAQSAVSRAVMMLGMLPLIKRERSLALWDCRISPALFGGQSAEVMHASSCSYNALVWLWTGGAVPRAEGRETDTLLFDLRLSDSWSMTSSLIARVNQSPFYFHSSS